MSSNGATPSTTQPHSKTIQSRIYHVLLLILCFLFRIGELASRPILAIRQRSRRTVNLDDESPPRQATAAAPATAILSVEEQQQRAREQADRQVIADLADLVESDDDDGYEVSPPITDNRRAESTNPVPPEREGGRRRDETRSSVHHHPVEGAPEFDTRGGLGIFLPSPQPTGEQRQLRQHRAPPHQPPPPTSPQQEQQEQEQEQSSSTTSSPSATISGDWVEIGRENVTAAAAQNGQPVAAAAPTSLPTPPPASATAIPSPSSGLGANVGRHSHSRSRSHLRNTLSDCDEYDDGDDEEVDMECMDEDLGTLDAIPTGLRCEDDWEK